MDDSSRRSLVTRESSTGFQTERRSGTGTALYQTEPLRDLQTVVQDLKRENFNLKLRIYFLEEAGQTTDECPIHRENVSSAYDSRRESLIQQLRNENKDLRHQLAQLRHSRIETGGRNDDDDERRFLLTELERLRRENSTLRLSHNTTQSIQTTTIDSGLDTTTQRTLNTMTSEINTLQAKLREANARERELRQEIDSVKRQIALPSTQVTETSVELHRAREQLNQFQEEIYQYQQQQSKAERVLKRMQTDYEARIANLVQQQQQMTTSSSTYQHEPLTARIRVHYPVCDKTNRNVDVDGYNQAIEERDRIIRQLEEVINENTIRLRTPFNMVIPSRIIESSQTDEHNRQLIQNLNAEMQTHLRTVDQLRAECVELRRTEQTLRTQVGSLVHLLEATPAQLPPRPPSTKIVDTVEGVQRVGDLQSTVVYVNSQLQHDAETVSALTNRVAQMMRDRSEWQVRIDRLEREIDQKNVHIRQMENRELEIETRIRQQTSIEIENFRREINTLQTQIGEREELIRRLRVEIETSDMEGKRRVQEQLRTATMQITDLEQQLTIERRKITELEHLRIDRRQITELEEQLRIERRQISELEQRLSIEQRQVSELEQQLTIERRQSTDREQFRIERRQVAELEERLITEQRQLTELEQQLTIERRQVTELQQQLITERRQYSEREQFVIERHQITELEQRLSIEQRQVAELEERLSIEQRQVTELQQQLITERRQFSEREQFVVERRQIVELEQQLIAERRQITELEQRLTIEHRQVTELEERLTIEQRQITELQQQLITERRQYSEREQFVIERRQIVELEQQLIAERRQITELEQRLTIEHRQVNELEQRLSIEQRQITELQQQLITERRQYSEREQFVIERRQIVELEQQLIAERRQIAELEQRLTIEHRQVNELQQQLIAERRQYSEREQFVIERRQITELEQQLIAERREKFDLQRKYESTIQHHASQIEQWEIEIQKQAKQIEEFRSQRVDHTDVYQQKQRQWEREIKYEREKYAELELALHTTKMELERYQSDTSSSTERIRSLERRVQDYEQQMVLIERERDTYRLEVQNITREIQSTKERYRDSGQQIQLIQDRYDELTREYANHKAQTDVLEIRIHDYEDDIRKLRKYNEQLKIELEEAGSKRNRSYEVETNEWRSKYEMLLNDKRQADLATRTKEEEIEKLTQEIEQLTVHVRVHLDQPCQPYQHVDRWSDSTEDTQNYRRKFETTSLEYSQSETERQRLSERLRVVESILEQSNEKSRTYELTIERLQDQIKEAERKRIELEKSYSFESDSRFQRFQNLEQQVIQYERDMKELRSENEALVQKRRLIESEYEEYRHQQQLKYEKWQHDVHYTTQQTSEAIEERIRQEVLRINESKQKLISRLERDIQERDTLIQNLNNDLEAVTREPKKIRIEFQSQIRKLESTIESYSQTIQEKDRRIAELLEQGESKTIVVVRNLQEENQVLQRRIESIQRENRITITELERHVSELTTTNQTLQRIEERFNEQQRELVNIRHKYEIVVEDFNAIKREKETLTEEYQQVKRQLTMTTGQTRNTEEIAHYKLVVDDLHDTLRQRDERIQSLQQLLTVEKDNVKVKEVIIQDTDSQRRYSKMEKKMMADIEDRERIIVSLRSELSEKETQISQLRTQISVMKSDESRKSYSAERTTSNINMKMELERKEQEIITLQRRLDQALRDLEEKKSTTSRGTYTTAVRAHVTDSSLSPRFGHLNPEELLYELEMALQDNATLVQQLSKMSVAKTKEISVVDSGFESSKSIQTLELQRQIQRKDDDIQRLTKDMLEVQRQLDQARTQIRQHETSVTQVDHTRSQTRQYEAVVTQLDQAQDQNQRLRGEIKLLQNEINSNKTLIERYQKEIRILEQIRETKGGQGEIAITTHEMSELLNEMRRLRQELERSIKVQNELQAKLDENLRQCRAPREIRFSGRGVSYPDLRLIDGLGLDTSESISMSTMIDDRRSRPIGSSTDALNRHSEYEHQSLGKRYIIGELEDHERLRRLIADIKIELSQIQLKLKEKMRSKTDTNDLAWLERRSATLTQCLQRLEESYNLIEHYWKAHLPIKNKFEEHSFVDRRLADDYKELQSTNTKVLQESQQLRQKYNEQSAQMEQVLSHLTKANRKKADTGDYLALLLRPTLDVLQKARSNIEHHLQESQTTKPIPSGSTQSRRRQRPLRLD